jgi:hypothetical protein
MKRIAVWRLVALGTLLPTLLTLSLLTAALTASAQSGDTLVSVGSPTSPFAQNKQNEPAIAVDANNPTVLAAGSNDEIDLEACNAGDPTTCPFTQGVGVSGIYFSFDSGATWMQPTYTGWSARKCLGPDPCNPQVGSIGTLPWYYENGLVSDGDPALAFGPKPDAHGHFAWANGSRLYYANLTSNFSEVRSEQAFKGYESVYVSRIDGNPALTPDIVSNKDNWMAPVLVSKQNATLFSDKEQIWADNAASSPFFGNVYICNAAFRSNSHGNAYPVPILVSVSSDGGNTWKTKQVSQAATNNQHGSRSGCTIRTDSHGVVYLFYAHFAVGTPGTGAHTMLKSYDGGHTWTRPQDIFSMNDACYNVDPVSGRCVEDGIAGARNDLTAAPSIDIANGAPAGTDATDEIVDTWADGREGLNNEQVMLAYSTDNGQHWSDAMPISTAGDRGYYSAAGISPNGTDLYITYNAFTTPYRTDTSSPRTLVGVVLHADLGTNGAWTNWSELHRGAPGDPRGSSQNNLVAEFLGDYVYTVATRTYGAGVWNDVRNAADCTAIDDYRMSLENGQPLPPPAPNNDCPATWGNSDIYGGAYADPTP